MISFSIPFLVADMPPTPPTSRPANKSPLQRNHPKPAQKRRSRAGFHAFARVAGRHFRTSVKLSFCRE